MATRDQERASLAFAHVKDVQEADRAKYASMVHSLPTLLRTAGLSQALHFVDSRPNSAQKLLLSHLAKQVQKGFGKQASYDSRALLDDVRKAPVNEYQRLTHEILACSNWYRRMVQGVLKIQAAEADRAAE